MNIRMNIRAIALLIIEIIICISPFCSLKVIRLGPLLSSYRYSNNIVISCISGYMKSTSRALDLRLNFSSDIEPSDADEKATSIYEDILNIIDLFCDAESQGKLGTISPTLLTENSHILSKGRMFEQVMDAKLSFTEGAEDIKVLEKVNNYLKGFVNSERKSRARLKVNYILAGASSRRLDESIQLLSESDEIDDYLLSYLDSLIQKEVLRAAGPTATSDNSDLVLSGIGSDTVEVLKLVKKRLIAEKELSDRQDIKILAQLLKIADPKEREKYIRGSFRKVEDLEKFTEFVYNGIQHIKESDSKDVSIDSLSRRKPEMDVKSAQVSVGTFEKMKDVLYSLEIVTTSLQTGLATDDKNDIYSTSPEDYTPQ